MPREPLEALITHPASVRARLSNSLFFFFPLLVSVSQHMNAADEAYMLGRPSSLFWCDGVTALSCLEISSVTLTPMSSPESNMSGGLLTPPPAKPPLLPPKPPEGCSIPRPRVNLAFLSSSSCLSPLSPPRLASGASHLLNRDLPPRRPAASP